MLCLMASQALVFELSQVLVQVGIIQFSTDVHIQQPLAHVDRDNLLGVMTDMVSRQLALAMQQQFQDAPGTPCMSGYNV